ncbi:hypothetical protein C6P40_004549 [Pichia californica]|uniref:Uncharacterized protein n=1 Tax=Pichia californica TaxID=460514 RepID=A0A9P7BEU2_9ASCO|nr:hypothetical protein C6P42_005006 [[Candida] californica]KAG0689747.1 hypothetical protein C6P40_004549 [[Candida] californica]
MSQQISNPSSPSPSLPSPNNANDFTSLSKLASQWAKSPYPAWTFSAALLISPLLRPKIPLIIDSSTGYAIKSKFPNSKKLLSSYPSNIHIAIFSSFISFGGFMCYDNDLIDGQLVISVWSFLYFLSNSRKSLWNFKIYPKFLSGFALINSAFYSAKYFNFI